ncbi:MAG TPA: alpha/beta hydrolase [Thermoanaerobaculia bacterium]|nr:alpha/beta hydrolase [Thermoanaerobaculia bacterium]
MIVSVDHAELFYSIRGQGPACLVLSAIGTRPYEIQMPPQLSERLRLVFVDLRGGGQSTGEPEDLTFERLADDLEAIRADVGVERIAVLGHSMLGALAIEYGRRRPQSVWGVIAVGSPPRGDLAQVAAAAAAFFERDASDERQKVLRDNLARLPAGAPLAEALYARTPMRFFDPRFDAAPLFAGSVLRPKLLQHLMGPLTRDWDLGAVAASYPVPLLVAHGRFDYVVPHFLWQDLAGTIPGATLRIFERSGHQPFCEEPEAFAATIAEWMRPTRPLAEQG